MRHALAAVHFILIGLDGDARQRRIAADVVRFTKEAVPCAEPALEKLEQVDLAAGFREHIEILIVDVNVAVDVRRGNVFGQHIVVDEILRAFRTIFEHGSHGGIRINIRILALDVHIARVLEG